MPSLLTRLAQLFPGYSGRAAPPVETPEARATRLLKAEREKLDRAARRPPPSTQEKLPSNYHGGVAGKVWFLPYLDSATKDSPEIRAAMRLMRRDPYVKAGWEPQILSVASEDWQVQASEPGNPASEEQAAFCKTVVEDYLAGGIVSVVRSVCAPFGSDGHSLVEPVWGHAERGRLGGKVVCTATKARDTDPNSGAVRLSGDEYGNVTHVESLRRPGLVFPIEDFVFSRYMTVFDEPLGEAAFRPSYGPYWHRDTVRKLRVIHHEKKMSGMLAGTYTDDDQKGPLEAALEKAKSATWITIPDGARVEALALSTASEPDYKSFDESLRDEIVQGIVFATLQILQGNVPDARGDTKVQKSMADLGPWLLMVLTTGAVNSQLFPRLIDFNYPYPAGGGYPKLTFGAVSNQELLELAQLVTQFQQLGFNPSRKHYASALSVQEADPNDPDDVLTAPQQGGFGGFGGPGGGVGGGGLPPTDPFAGGGGGGSALAFSENGVVHEFAGRGWRKVAHERGQGRYPYYAVNVQTGAKACGKEAEQLLAADPDQGRRRGPQSSASDQLPTPPQITHSHQTPAVRLASLVTRLPPRPRPQLSRHDRPSPHIIMMVRWEAGFSI